MRCPQQERVSRSGNIAPALVLTPNLSQVSVLSESDRTEVLAFLKKRPVHTVVMTSFIHDNGMESELNRGSYYGFRNRLDELEGVALIGHSTLVEARTEEALKALGFQARMSTFPIHLIMSTGNDANKFWNYLNGDQRKPALVCTELLFETSFPFPVQKCEFDLRPAVAGELFAVATAHAEVAEIESRVNPMTKDREGFLMRVMRRIEQGRVLVAFDGNELVFKADIIAKTDETAYIEGVYVGEKFRGRGVGSKCLSRLCLDLLGSVENVCLLSNAEFEKAHRSYLKAGLRHTDSCTTLFV